MPKREFALTGMPRIAWPTGGPEDIVVFYDFVNDTELSDWAFSQIGTHTVPSAVEDFDGGKVRMAHTTSTDNTGVAANYDAEFFKFTAGRRYLWAARVAFDDGTNGDYFAGMTITTVDPIAAAPTDGVYFRKDDGNTEIDVVVAKDTTTTSTNTNVATAVGSSTGYMTLAIYVETRGAVGDNIIEFYVDGVLVASYENTAELVDNEEMTLHLTAHNGATGAPNFMDVDWVYFACDRP